MGSKPLTIHEAKRSPFALTVNLDDPDPQATVKLCLERSQATQVQFAKMMGVSEGALSEWVNGVQRPPPVAVRAALFAAQMCAVPIIMPNPSQYLSGIDKRPRKTYVK